jgi:hypothetical protein
MESLPERSSTIPIEDVAAVLRRWARGETVAASRQSRWNDSAIPTYDVEGWRIQFFNDCGDLDYLDEVTAPDGREAEFGDWKDDDGYGVCPTWLLSKDERDALLKTLGVTGYLR